MSIKWEQLLRELQGWGVTQEQIADHCKVAQSTVSDLANGRTKSPSFGFGTALVALHGSESEKRAAEPPPLGGKTTEPQPAAVQG